MKDPKKTVTGNVQKKNNKWYMIINLYDEEGKRKPKWINTELESRGNKKKAEAMLKKELDNYNKLKKTKPNFLKKRDKMLFCDYAKGWLDYQKNCVDANSFGNDSITVNAHIYPYYKENQCLVKDIDADVINQYFEDKRNGWGNRKKLSETSLQRHHATLSSILNRAVKEGYIKREDVEDIVKPKNDTKQTQWYTCEQIQELIDALKSVRSKLLIPTILASYYSLRREEVVGIREEDINFETHMFFVNHAVVSVYAYDSQADKHKTIVVKKDKLKNESSRRAYPMFPELENYLKEAIETNRMYQKIHGDTYNKENIGYINVHENGNLITPDYITHMFGKFIKKNNFPKITFHGLRHSSASLLLQLGFSMKEVQLWLGHSSYEITARIYAHVDSQIKQKMADTLAQKITI